MTQMQRDAIKKLLQGDAIKKLSTSPEPSLHAGLWLSRGLPKWDADTKGKDFPAHIKRATELNIPAIYKCAYARWQKTVLESEGTIAIWCGQLDGRLFIGLGGASVLETAITLSRTYGVPVIPGSALKGLAHAYAETQSLLAPEAKELLFGEVSEKPEDSSAGYVLFHDAWWIPDSAKTPLCSEIVTVHHQEYYNGTADRATDFDSPVPNTQIAAHGSFLFTVECGDSRWAKYARDLLVKALTDWGIGGKTAAGYGRFFEDEGEKKKLEKARKSAKLAQLPSEERIRLEIEELTLDQIATMFGKEKNKTKKEWGDEYESRLALIREIHGATIRGWAESKKDNEKKAFKVIFPPDDIQSGK